MERVYSIPSWQPAITLFVILLGGMFIGFLLGKNAARHGEQKAGAADSAVKGAAAGLAALLLAFSFSLAAGRYDQRNTLVLREANSIRDTSPRADLLEEPTRGRIQQLLRDYLDARLKYLGVGFDPTQIAASAMASQQLQQRIWQVISEQSRISPQPGNISTMVPAASEMIDAGAAIEAAYSNTVPAIVLILLFGAIIFYGCAGRRFIWSCRAPPRAHGSGFRTARHARSISNSGSRLPAEGSDPGKYQPAGKSANDGATRPIHRAISDVLVCTLIASTRRERDRRFSCAPRCAAGSGRS